jgi:membrane dipeptidase
MKKILIDAHEDIAYAALTFNRDYSKSAAFIRQVEQFSQIPQWNGHAMLGYEDWKAANVGFVFSTIFVMHKKYQSGDWEKVGYKNLEEARKLTQKQIDFYHKLEDQHPDKFRIIKNQSQYMHQWEKLNDPSSSSNPIGLVLLLEGAEGLKHPKEIEEWYQWGVRMVGPAWAGGRYCGGMYEPGRLSNDGRLLLETMLDLNMGLDLAHMSEQSAFQSLDIYDGALFCSHANVKTLLKGFGEDRHLSDQLIRRIAERNGVMGLMPYNNFLSTDWTNTQPRDKVTLDHFVNHIDHICQLTGSVNHVAIGTDFDGGLGYPDVPLELNTIADLPKLSENLASRGYNKDDIESIFSLNWKRILDRIYS